MRNLVFLFVLFGFVYDMSLPFDSLNKHVLVYGNTIESSFRGDLYSFDVDLYGVRETSSSALQVYMYLVFPEGDTLLYQLDDVRQSQRKSYLSYSCVLCLTQLGKYDCNYFVVDEEGDKIFDPKAYNFFVFTGVN